MGDKQAAGAETVGSKAASVALSMQRKFSGDADFYLSMGMSREKPLSDSDDNSDRSRQFSEVSGMSSCSGVSGLDLAAPHDKSRSPSTSGSALNPRRSQLFGMSLARNTKKDPYTEAVREEKKFVRAARKESFWLRCRKYKPQSPRFEDHYVIQKVLGHGAYGTVYSAKLTDRAETFFLSFDAQSAALEALGKPASSAKGTNDQVYARYIAVRLRPPLSEETSMQLASATEVFAELPKREGFPFACKVLYKARVKNHLVMAEVRMLNRCCHPCILLIVEYIESKNCHYVMTARCYGSVMARVSGFKGSDTHMVGRLVEQCTPVQFAQIVQKWTRQILLALEHVHACGVVHRDVKPDNVFCSTPAMDTDIVVGDFGLSVEASVQTSLAGTTAFHSPELLLDQNGRTHEYGGPARFPPMQCAASDVWSAGIMLHLIVCERTPYEDFFDELREDLPESAFVSGNMETLMLGWFGDLAVALVEGAFVLRNNAASTVGLAKLSACLLEVEPTARYTCTQLLQKTELWVPPELIPPPPENLRHSGGSGSSN